MLNEERASDFARRYAAALLAEGRERLRDEVPSVPGELVAEVLWRIEAALPHLSRGQFELELLEISKHKGAGWRRYTTPRKRNDEEAERWKNWARTREQIARRQARIDAGTDQSVWNAPATTTVEHGETEYAPCEFDKPLPKGFAGDGAPMTFSKLRRIVIRAQVMLVEYAGQRCGENTDRLHRMIWHQSIALQTQLDAINAWEACHRILKLTMNSGGPLANEQLLFDQEFQRLQSETLNDLSRKLKQEKDSLAILRENYRKASPTRR